jgi:hypothetical protein
VLAGQPRKVAGQPSHVAIAPPWCTKVMVVEPKTILVEKKVGKGGVGGQPTSHFGRPAKPWPPHSPNFLHPPHLLSLVLKPLTKSIKSKVISLHSFSKFLLFYFWNFWFSGMQWWKQKHAVEKE